MKPLRLVNPKHRSFSSSSSIPWISPIQFSNDNYFPLDPPPESSSTQSKPPRSPRFIDQDSAVQLIKQAKDSQRVLDIFNRVAKQKGFSHNHSTYYIAFEKLAQKKKFKAIDGLLRQMSYEVCKFEETIFLNLMKHYSKAFLHHRVVGMFYAIQHIACEKPSPKAITTCLNLLLSTGQLDLAKNILLHCKTLPKFQPNTCVFNIILKHHCKRGNLTDALEVLEEMKKHEVSFPNLKSYSTIMGGFCKAGRFEEAIGMLEEGVTKVQMVPDALTYNTLIDGFCRAGAVSKAEKVLNFMGQNKCPPSLVNYSTLMNGYCKAGDFEKAKEVFEKIKGCGFTPDTMCYTSLMECMCRVGKVDEAVKMMGEMREMKCRIDSVTWNVVIGGLCKAGRVEETMGVVELEDVGLSKYSYRIVLNCLMGKGELEKATYLVDLMVGRGFLPHHVAANDFVTRLCGVGMADHAIRAAFGMMGLGFALKVEVWSCLVDVVCRERMLLYSFELVDDLVGQCCIESVPI